MKVLAGILIMGVILVGCASEEAPGDVTAGFSGALGLGAEQTIDEGVFYELHDLFEDSVQRCMKGQGFEYLPQPGSARTGRVGDDGGLSDEEYASEFGFGIAAALFDSGSTIVDASTQSVNDAYLAGLSEEAQKAWRAQLEDCMRSGYERQDRAGMLVAPFDEARIEIEQLVDVDSRVAAAENRWAACMSASGFAYGTFAEMFDSLLAEGRALAGSAPGADQVVSADAPPVPFPQGAAFAQREVAAAVANQSCAEELTKVRSVVRTELETERLGSDESLRRAADAFREATANS